MHNPYDLFPVFNVGENIVGVNSEMFCWERMAIRNFL